MHSIEREVRKIIAQKIGRNEDAVTLESLYRDLGVDSLATVDLLLAFEYTFGVEIPDEDAAQMSKVRDTVEYILFAIEQADIVGDHPSAETTRSAA